mmetsp:Transcript_46771/g.108130  ORF Transcript_46771/g.108130 Transcript_46771/m.108130 type:complete len:327 (-) Transcript_46771:267-1247(-)
MLLAGLGGLSAMLLAGLAPSSPKLSGGLGLGSEAVEISSTSSTNAGSATPGAPPPQLLHCTRDARFTSPHSPHSQCSRAWSDSASFPGLLPSSTPLRASIAALLHSSTPPSASRVSGGVWWACKSASSTSLAVQSQTVHTALSSSTDTQSSGSTVSGNCVAAPAVQSCSPFNSSGRIFPSPVVGLWLRSEEEQDSPNTSISVSGTMATSSSSRSMASSAASLCRLSGRLLRRPERLWLAALRRLLRSPRRSLPRSCERLLLCGAAGRQGHWLGSRSERPGHWTGSGSLAASSAFFKIASVSSGTGSFMISAAAARAFASFGFKWHW